MRELLQRGLPWRVISREGYRYFAATVGNLGGFFPIKCSCTCSLFQDGVVVVIIIIIITTAVIVVVGDDVVAATPGGRLNAR